MYLLINALGSISTLTTEFCSFFPEEELMEKETLPESFTVVAICEREVDYGQKGNLFQKGRSSTLVDAVLRTERPVLNELA